jgi:hypothetical protein
LLSYASPVFKAFLSPRFKEGSQLATQSFVEIPLPDDEVTLMSYSCELIHLRPKQLQEPFGSKEILAFAQLCDKYDCLDLARASVGEWVRDELQIIRGLGKYQWGDALKRSTQLLAAAYLVGNKEAMHGAAVEVVAYSESAITGGQCADLLPAVMCCEYIIFDSFLLALSVQVLTLISPLRSSPYQHPEEHFGLCR